MRALIADDHHLVREAFAAYLRSHWRDLEIAEAASLADALQRVASDGPFDLVILDLVMPGMAGIKGLVEMRERSPESAVVLISGDMPPTLAMEALNRGARGVLTKDMKGKAILNALEIVIGGEQFLPTALAQSAIRGRGAATEQRLQMRKALGNLTERETDVLNLLAQGKSNREIAAALSLSETTIKLHLNRVFAKAQARNRSDAVRRFYEVQERLRRD